MTFRVGVTRDFRAPDGSIGWGDIGLSALEQVPGVEWEFLPADPDELDELDELPAELVAAYDGLLVLTPRVSAASLARADRLRIVARFGVGYDNVDVAACTDAG